MNWWMSALYDTCSLISLDELIQLEPAMSSHFQRITVLEASFSKDRMREDRVSRMQPIATIQATPSVSEMAIVLKRVRLSVALSEVDKLIFATADHFDLPVITADKRLARALKLEGRQVANIALILQQLVAKRCLGQRACSTLLKTLALRNEFLLGNLPPEWKTLRDYTFPD